MAYYAYKTVRDLLPEHIIKQMDDGYEGAADYDGDQWYAAEAYILELLEHRKELLEALDLLLNDVGRANSMLGAVKARAAIAKATGGQP